MTPVEIETAARAVVFDHLDGGVEFLDIVENYYIQDDIDEGDLEEVIKQIQQRLKALISHNNEM